MLKNLGYDGAYHDENISISILLENPLNVGLESSALVFSVTFRTKNGNVPRHEDFTFYVMDETNLLHNVQSAPYSKRIAEPDTDDEPVRRPDGLIHTNLQPDFLFQDLRIAFYYRPYMKIQIIKLKH